MPKSHLDSGSCIRHSYSNTDEALRIIPSSNTSFAIELDATDGDTVATRAMSEESSSWFSVAAINSAENSPSVDITNYRGYAVQVVATGLDAADATVDIEASIDGTNFAPLGAAITLASGSSVRMVNAADANYKYFRMAYQPGSVTAGTIAMEYMVKG